MHKCGLIHQILCFECTVLNACEKHPCQNGGVCILLESGHRCNCPERFEGVNCETLGEHKKLGIYGLICLLLLSTVIEILTAPVIALPPFNSSIPIHTPLNLSCMATGVPPPQYTWFKDGVLIPGETKPFLYIPEVQPNDRGSYRCKAANSVGEVTSEVAALTIPGMCCEIM